MPFGYAETKLWVDTLAPQTDDRYGQQRAALATAYHKLRERAALLAGEIPQDLREYTVHDVTHLDALWELADTIAGPDVTLTPTEAFVLGGAFLVHDLGMGLVAWPDGLDQLKKDPSWNDVLAGAISRATHESVTPEQMESPGADVLKAATETLLRERHAEQGANLALVGWKSLATEEEYKLIEDVDLRTRFGPLIGEIASSHGWDLARVAARFGDDRIGAPVDCPDEWTVDPLKLACLLRVADAAHLDERRAPGFLRALRRPSGYSDLHWAFQGFLQRAHRVEDRLLFTSARPFELNDAAAWWLCLDSLRMVDRELSSVDSLLRDRSRTRFAAHGVKGVEDPARLSEMIRTSGWEPVNAEVAVSDVPGLVRKLGGESLYGNHPRVALRELLQNARDASVALAALLDAPAQAVVVRLEREGTGEYWLSVDDSGIGMSRELITGPLLDFGTSYWGSDLMRRESVGLASTGYSAVGRFGIGFYAVFMLGDMVDVVSRRFDEASVQTKVLSFSAGPSARPIYRVATPNEQRHMGGTSVRIKLRSDPFAPGGLLHSKSDDDLTLEQCCALIAPALDVDLIVRYLDEVPVRTVAANDWIGMDPKGLLRRISPEPKSVWAGTSVAINEVASRMRPIEIAGKVVARISITPSPPGAVDEDGDVRLWAYPVIGGLNTEDAVGGLAGIITASATTADRLKSRLNIDGDSWREWSTEQAVLWASILNDQILKGNYEADMTVGFLFRLNADTGPVVVARTADGLLNARQLRDWMSTRDEVTLIDSYSVDVVGGEMWHRRDHVKMSLGPNVVIGLGSGGRYGNWDLLGDEHPDKDFKPTGKRQWPPRDASEWFYFNQLETEGVLIRELSSAWETPLADILRSPGLRIAERGATIGASSGGNAVLGHAEWIAKRA